MTIPAWVNCDFLYRSPDGREGFVLFDREKKLAYIGPDINSEHKFPVGLTADMLRKIADNLDNHGCPRHRPTGY